MSSFPPDTPESSGLGSLQNQAGSSLGSLKQQARGKNLRAARIALGLASFLMFAQAALEYFTIDSQLDAAFEKEIKKMGPGFVVDRTKLKQIKEAAAKVANLFCLGVAVLGVVFLVLTVLVYRFPLFCTVGGLILYIGFTLIMAYLIVRGHEGADIFAELWKGALWKVVITIGLLKGIQAALAYQREQAATNDEQALPGV